MAILLRPATAADQPTITAIIRKAQLNPLALDWPRFVVAEEAGKVVGVGQVKPHGDGSRELASIAVIPEYQGQGIGRQIIQKLLATEAGVVYLFCEDKLEGYYARFGFEKVERAELPPVMARIHRMATLMAKIGSRLGPDKFQVLAMRRAASAEYIGKR